MDRTTLVNEICKEVDIRQPDRATEGYLPKRILMELLLTIKKMNDEIKRLSNLEGLVDAETKKKDAINE
jgi:hypothetical protein